MEKKTWTTRDGTEIAISDMKTSHLENAIRMLERTAEKGTEVVLSYGYDGDDDFMTGEIDTVKGDEYLKRTPYKHLVAELKKRSKSPSYL